MTSRNYRKEVALENWSNFEHIDSFSSLGHAVINSLIDTVTGPVLFTTEFAARGLKIAIQQIRTY